MAQNYEKLLDGERRSQEYQDDDDDQSPTKARKRKPTSWCTSLILALSVSALVLSGVSVGLLGYYLGKETSSQSTVQKNKNNSNSQDLSNLACGTTASEAHALGCVFDLITNNWIPKQCADPETTAEFREWVSNNARLRDAWPYYFDGRGTQQITSEEEMSGMVGQRLYTTTENHLGHCTFLMRRLHRFLNSEDGAVIARINLNHTIHCSREILKAVGNPECDDRGRITSGFDVGIAGC